MIFSISMHHSPEEERPEITQHPISTHILSAPIRLEVRHRSSYYGLGVTF